MTQCDVISITSKVELDQAFAIRREVFVVEQAISETLDFDGRDDDALHLLAVINQQPVGTLRIRQLDGGRTAKIERVAVLRSHRRAGVGAALMQTALDEMRKRGATRAALHAQVTVASFYRRLGFADYGEVFEEDGIPHIAMKLPLTEA